MCELFWYGPCSSGVFPFHSHHIVNKGKYRSKKLKVYYDKSFFKATLCPNHNVGRMADTKWARKLFIENRVSLYGEPYVRRMLDEAPWKHSVPPEFTFEGIMAGPSPPRDYDNS